MLLAHRLRGDDAVAEGGGQRGNRRRDRGRIAGLFRRFRDLPPSRCHRAIAFPRALAANVAGMADEVKRPGMRPVRAEYGAKACSEKGCRDLPRRRVRNTCQASAGWSFFGSAGLLLLADIAHATIITASNEQKRPRAILPNIAPSPLIFLQDSRGIPPRSGHR